MSYRLLAASVLLVCAGCFPLPRYAYLAETRVEVSRTSGGFSEVEVERAKLVSEEVAQKVRMKSDMEHDRVVEIERTLSSNKRPPRRFISAYSGTTRTRSVIQLRLEISSDSRVLYYSISDRDRGTATPTVARIRSVMMEQVEAAFPDAAIVHEAQSLGPFFDGFLDPV